MNWAELHGEHGDTTPPRPSKTAKFCENCQCWVELADMKYHSPDGYFVARLCNGCDAELYEPTIYINGKTKTIDELTSEEISDIAGGG